MLDKDKSGEVTMSDVAKVYDTSQHPEVKEGAKTPEQVLTQFMSQWDTLEKDGIITKVRCRQPRRRARSAHGASTTQLRS